ncbi:trypsin-like peptidase domain-containing protein [Ruminococcus sp. HUN007]|uniref:S1C family serine protease n=1 Tax=Ruminococcus sp. HUN007 TaxID=1514668 RepID=UPI000679DF81|nr:trypsin-like peptidase domain-containing protein [Ruminococcus sp. HUN007]
MEQFENNTTEPSGGNEEKAVLPENVFDKELLIYDAEKFLCDTDYRNRLQEREERTPKPAVFLSICAVLLILAFAVYCIVVRSFRLKDSFYSPGTRTTVVLGLNSRPDKDEDLKDSTGRYTSSGICQAVGPSVVEIIIYEDGKTDTPSGSGSGIILSADGYIATNAHVIQNGKTVKAVLSDKSVFTAEVVGYDAKTDIGVVKIAPGDKKLKPAEFGNSDDVIQGEQVMAIGNPGGLHGSISGGYVSGINRMIRGDQTGREMNCIQTDAAISPGNSGGALVNMFGQVIGITSSKYVSSSYGYEGLGFAIAINDAKPVIEELVANGFISGRFKVGITFYEITAAQSAASGLPEGLLIESMDENCDISKSGLKAKDIIVEIENIRVNDYDSFMDAINRRGKKAGDKVRAKAVRVDEKDTSKRETIDFEFTLVEDTSGNY